MRFHTLDAPTLQGVDKHLPNILARTWTAYTDVGRVQRASLGIANSDQIWVAALDPDGEVLAETLGPPTDASAVFITAAMEGGR